MSTLGDLTAPKIDQSGPPTDGDFIYIDISSIDNRLKRIVEPKRLPVSTAPSRARQRLQPGDVLVSMTRPNLNAVAIVSPDLEGAVGSTGFHVLRAVDGIESRWLFYAVQTRDFVETMSSLVQGALYPAVRPKDIRAFDVQAPPFDEQRRIVAEIEKQFSRLDEAVANLKRVKANLKRYKAAVLKAAVEGKLTEDWRLSARAASRKRAQASELETVPKAGKGKWFIYIIECNDGSFYVGHTSDLHARWQAHCDGNGADWTRQHPPKHLVHFEECGSREDAVKREQDLKTGFGRTWRKREIVAGRMKPLVHNPANVTAQPVHGEDMQTGSKLLDRILAERRAKWTGRGKYKEPIAPDSSNLPSLPQGWTWASVDQVAEVSLGKMLDQNKHRTGRRLPYLRNINVRWGRVQTDDLLEMFFESDELDRYGLKPGDVLVCEGGEPGRAAVWDGRIPELKYQKALHRVRFYGTTEACYLVFLLEFLADTGRLERWFTGSTIKHFTRESFVSMPIPLPSLAEQEQIVAEVERRLSVIEELEAAVEANLTRADRLRQATLAKAFSGHLLSGPNNEA